MYRRIFSQKQKLVALAFVAFLGIILSGFVASVIAEALDNDVQVEPDSELTYYLKVKYDGVDKEGVQSNDATMAKINSGRIKVTDKIPDGLTFKSFVTSDNGSIGAVSRADSTVSCSGRVIDDTQEALNDTGVWNTDNSEYTYHGLHYDANSRTVSFYVESLKAGCELTVGIITQTPETVDNPATTVVETRRDFYNTALATEGLISAPSNTVHAFMSDKNAEMYKVTYAYTGTVPGNAPALPPESEYATDSSVGVATIPSLDGYTFTGWTTSDVSISNGSFIMPAGNVVLEGYFTENPAETKYTVTYRIDGDKPEDFIAPKEKSYPAGAEISLDSTEPGTVIDGYRFIGWTTEDVELSDTGFAMPEKNVVIVGKFERISYKVSYQFQGTILPPDADNLLPATTEHYPGETVTTAAHPTADGYRFLGWYKKSTFTMPEEDVVIYGEWGLQSGTFSPTITKEIENPKASYTQGDTVRFKTTVTNTASHAIHNVMIQEQLEDAKFVTGSGYTVVSDYLAEADNMAPGASIILYSEFTVTENKEKEYTNTVELIGALADDNYFLDTGKDYKASVGFTVKEVLTPAVIVGPLTEDGIVKYIFVFTVSTACLILAAIQIRKHISIQKRTLKRIGIFVGSFAGTILLLATAGKVIAANYTVPVKSVTLTSTHTSYESNEPGSWNIEKSARWTGQGKAQITFDVSSIMKTSEGHKDLIFVLDNSGSMSGDKLARVKHATVGIATALISIQAGDCFIRCLHKIWETADKAVNAVLALPLNRHIQMPSLLHATPQTHPAPCSLP